MRTSEMTQFDIIHNFVEKINVENGSNYKINVLKEISDSRSLALIQRVLKMTLDRVKFNYGIGRTSLEKIKVNHSKVSQYDLCEVLDILEIDFCSRNLSGNAAIEKLTDIFNSLRESDCSIIKKIIERDLKIGIGKTQINKVFKNLITKPVYMRCDVYSKKTSKNISFPAVVQLKADGTYREFNVTDGNVFCQSRAGMKYDYPNLNETLCTYPNGIFTGELTVILDDMLFDKIKNDIEKSDKKNGTDLLDQITADYNAAKEAGKDYILPRSLGNGLINSDDVPFDNLKLELWDYITHKDYQLASCKKTPIFIYKERLNSLINIIDEKTKNIKVIPFKVVDNLKEALIQTSTWVSQGYEGSVLKDYSNRFKDGTSKTQLKLKLKISLEVRCIGFKPGTTGTKREGKVGSLIYANDEKTIMGNASGFTDEELDKFTETPEIILNKVFEVECNDITRARNKKYYALSHPRFIEIRSDKDETDTLEKAFRLKESAMELA